MRDCSGGSEVRGKHDGMPGHGPEDDYLPQVGLQLKPSDGFSVLHTAHAVGDMVVDETLNWIEHHTLRYHIGGKDSRCFYKPTRFC